MCGYCVWILSVFVAKTLEELTVGWQMVHGIDEMLREIQ